MQKMLIEERDRWRKTAEDGQVPVKRQSEQKGQQPDAEIQDQRENVKGKKSNKLFPESALFKSWGGNLSKEDQKEAQALFLSYGYNGFLSDRLPLDRPLPDTRDPRYSFYHFLCQTCHSI